MNEIPATVSSSLLGERACSSLSLFPKDPGGSKAVMALPPKSPTNEVTMAGPIGDAAAAHFEKQLSAKIYRGLFELARLIRRIRIIAFPRLQVEPAMSALGQKQTFAVQKGMSALPPIADMAIGSAVNCHGPTPISIVVTNTMTAAANGIHCVSIISFRSA